MKVVVTGGAGFIGANLCRRLVADGVDEVVAVDDLSSGFASNLDGVGAELVHADMGDPGVLDAVLPGASSVVHLGARPSVPRSIEDPLASHHANATGTLQVLEGIRRHGVPHVVVASSSSVYGQNPTLPKHEELVPMPLSPYTVSKLATEAYALSYAECFGVRALAFRFFNVFGPLQAAGHAYAAVVPAFVSTALAGEPVTVHGDGEQTRDFTFVGSVCEVISAAVRDGVVSDRPVNLAFGGRSSLLELLVELEAVLGRPIERVHSARRAGDVRDSQADQTHLRALFPDIVPIEIAEGLRRTVAWFDRSRDVKVLVTGVAGFIGSQLAETLAAAGDEVIGIDSITDYYDVAVKRANVAAVSGAGVRFVEADLRYSDLAPFVDGAEVVYHQAAQPGVRASWDDRFADYATHNVLGTQRLLEASRHAGVRRFVYTSSSSIYGNTISYPTLEETVPAPFSPYGVTKLAAEHLCKAYAQNFGFPTVSLRYFTVYGPRQRPDMSIHRLIEAALGGPAFPLFGDGTQVREFTEVSDVVRANRLAAAAEVVPGSVFNISGGSEIVLADLIALVESTMGATVAVEERPAVPGDVRRNGGSTVRAREQLGVDAADEPRRRVGEADRVAPRRSR